MSGLWIKSRVCGEEKNWLNVSRYGFRLAASIESGGLAESIPGSIAQLIYGKMGCLVLYVGKIYLKGDAM
jgi:hypothetical protein